MTDQRTVELVIVGLCKAGEVAVIAKPGAELVKDLLGRLLGPVADTGGRILAHPLEEWHNRRVQQAHKTVQLSARMVVDAGAEPRPVPGRIFWPVLERGSMEESTELQVRWAALLANAAINADTVRPAFPHTLGELSSSEVRLLNWIYENTPPRIARVNAESDSLRRAIDALTLTEDEVPLIIGNLERLRMILVQANLFDAHDVRTFDFMHLGLTALGEAFVAACSPPPRRP